LHGVGIDSIKEEEKMYGANESKDIVAEPFRVSIEEEVAEQARRAKEAKRAARRFSKEKEASKNGLWE